MRRVAAPRVADERFPWPRPVQSAPVHGPNQSCSVDVPQISGRPALAAAEPEPPWPLGPARAPIVPNAKIGGAPAIYRRRLQARQRISRRIHANARVRDLHGVLDRLQAVVCWRGWTIGPTWKNFE